MKAACYFSTVLTRLGACAGLAFLVVAAPGIAGQQATAPAPVDHPAIINKYCVTCHNDRTKTGGLSLQNMDYDNQHFQTFNHRSGDVVMPKIDFKEPIKIELDHFLDCIEKGIEPITGIDHARKVVQILEGKPATRLETCEVGHGSEVRRAS